MKRFVKLVAVALAALLVAASLSACGGNPDAGSLAPESNRSTETVELDLVKEGTLVMGTNAEFPPFEYKEGTGFAGIDVDLMRAIAEKMGLELEVEDMAFESLTQSFGRIDVIAAGFTIDPTREATCDFSDTYFNATQTVILKADSTIATLEDLKGKKIGVQTGTTGDIYCTDDYGQENVKQFNNGPLAVAALVNGQIDCVVIDQEPAKNYVAANSGLKILDTAYADEDYAIAIKKGNTELLDKVNGALKELQDDGTLQAIVDKYITAE